jgi:hypothetical protein
MEEETYETDYDWFHLDIDIDDGDSADIVLS